jgi:hypothetical protein
MVFGKKELKPQKDGSFKTGKRWKNKEQNNYFCPKLRRFFHPWNLAL